MISRFLLALTLAVCVASPSWAQTTAWPPLGGRAAIPAPGWYGLPHVWTGQQAQPKCPLTDAAVITINAACANGSGLYTVTLGGNRVLGFPSRTSAAGVQWFTLEVTQDSTGSRTLTPEAGYAFPLANINANGTLLLSTVPKNKDVLTCWNISSTAWDCSGPQVAVTQWVHLLQSHSTAAVDATGVTTAATTISTFTAGHTGIFLISWCRDGTNCTTSSSADTTSVTATGGACSLIGAFITTTALPIKAYRCTGMATGSVTFTANWGANVFFWDVTALEMINDNGAEGFNTASGSTGDASTTTGTLSQPSGEYIVSFSSYANSDATGVSAPAVFFSDTHTAAYIMSGCSACTQAVSFTGGSAPWTSLIFALKTP